MLKEMLTVAVANGFTLQAVCEGETDYIGEDVVECLEALEACDEMDLYILLCNDYEYPETVEGWAFIVNEDEKIADCSGWVAKYLDGLVIS